MQEQIEFIIPDGYIKDEENTTDKKIVYKLKEKSPIAKDWEEVCNMMFPINSKLLYIDYDGEVNFINNIEDELINKNNLTSEAQGEKLMAINQLMTVAKYLNGLYPEEANLDVILYINSYGDINTRAGSYSFVTFKTTESAEKAFEILGEDVIKLALTANNY